MQEPPEWIEVKMVAEVDDPVLSALDKGERSAIVLGMSLNADLILIDERRGAVVAMEKGLEVTGTIGILDLAADLDLVDLAEAFDRLKRTNFRYRQSLLDAVLKKHGL